MQVVVSAAAEFAGPARRELDAALPPGAAVEELAPGAWLVSAPGRLADLTSVLRATVFVRHACPAGIETDTRGGPDGVAERVAKAIRIGTSGPVQVQVRLLPGAPPWAPGKLVASVRAALAHAGSQTTGGPADRVVSVTVAEDRALAGWGPVRDNLSPWPGGIARLRAAPDEVSRSARKLEEAVLLFGVPVTEGMRVLDLGAAPGGWTGWLLGRGALVTAVDTGALAPQLGGRPGLTFVRGSALQVPVPPGPFGLLCTDLNWDPSRAARCAVRFRPALAPGAHGIFTVKFFEGDPLVTVARVRERLEAGGLRVSAIRHLFHNRAEAMAHLRS